MAVPDGKITSYRKGQAINRPTGYIASHRSKVLHLVEGRMTTDEYVAFDVLLHIVGWDRRKPNFGSLERNISRLHREWFPFWSRPMLIKQLKALSEKGYILDEGQLITIKNFGKYQKGVTDMTDSVTTVTEGVTAVTDSVTAVTLDPTKTRATTASAKPKETNKLKEINNPPYPQGGKWSEHFEVLSGIKGYPLDAKTDEANLARLEQDFPKVDLLAALKSWAAYKLDKPFEKTSSPRSQLRTWVSKSEGFNRDLKPEAKPQGPQYKQIELTDEDRAWLEKQEARRKANQERTNPTPKQTLFDPDEDDEPGLDEVLGF